ncbi:MAG: patatin-like phospholipase family protein [Bacteroidales bacterium]|nr:patatin-like phospholipase family protein [Bacteroidales bacterium]
MMRYISIIFIVFLMLAGQESKTVAATTVAIIAIAAETTAETTTVAPASSAPSTPSSSTTETTTETEAETETETKIVKVKIKAIATDTAATATRPKIGVVLSGGGAKGVAHIGILRKIEDLGIPIDYIVGTSMGSIVGGLYAYGYNAAQLDTIFRSADWMAVLSDKYDRRYTYLTEKNTDDKYMFSLQFGKKIKQIMPISFIRGQHIENLFYTLTSDSYKYKSFDDFPIPFRCVGTELTTGKEYIFSNGNLAQAMRSSMAVPGVFNPVLYNDTLLMVDGGVVNNFPVDIVKEMGADIIIGVDVGFNYDRKASQYNFANIVEATVFIASRKKTESHRKMCDVLIQPNLGRLNSTSFGNVDSLLAVGYRAADSAEEALKKIADILAPYMHNKTNETTDHESISTPNMPNEIPHRNIGNKDKNAKVFVSHIEFKGLYKYTPSFANHALQIKENEYNNVLHISEGVERLYGTQVFNEVNYAFRQDSEDTSKTIVEIAVNESPNNAVKLGFRYDNEHDVVFLAGMVLRNIGFRNSRLLLDAEICRQPNISAEYLFMPNYGGKNKSYNKYTFWKPSIGIGYQFTMLNSELYRLSTFTIQRHSIRLRTNSNWRSSIFGFGVHIDYTRTKTNPVPVEEIAYPTDTVSNFKDRWYVYPYMFFEHNSYNARYYPTKGWKMNVDVKYVRGINIKDKTASEFFTAFMHTEGVISILKNHLSFYIGVTAASTFFQDRTYIPLAYRFYQGGQSPIQDWNISAMPGIPLTGDDGMFLCNATVKIQVKVMKNLYMSLRGGVGQAENTLERMFMIKNMIYGGNIGVSYETPIGPIGISFQTSNRMRFGVFLNVFYWY